MREVVATPKLPKQGTETVICRVRFALPFPIHVPSGTAWRVHANGRDGSVSVEAGDGAWLFSYLGDDLSWFKKPTSFHGPAAVAEKSAIPPKDESYAIVVRDHGKEVLNRLVFVTDQKDSFLRGYFDNQPFTSVTAAFLAEGRTIPELTTTGPEIGFELVREFVNQYRAISNHNHARDPVMSDSPVVEVFVCETGYKWTDGGYEGAFHRINRKCQWRLAELVGLGVEPLSEAQLDALGKALASSTSVSLHMLLLLDAKEQSRVHKNHAMGVVLSEAAFETYLGSLLSAACAARGVTELPIRSTRWPKRPVTEALSRASVLSDSIEIYCHELAGKSVKTTKAYQRWYDNAYDLRNRVIHSGHRDVTEGQARAAFESVVAYMNELWSVLSSGPSQ